MNNYKDLIKKWTEYTFSQAPIGYNFQEVDLFLDHVIEQFKKLSLENENLLNQLNYLKNELTKKDNECEQLKSLNAELKELNELNMNLKDK